MSSQIMEYLSPLFELDQIEDLFPFSPIPVQELSILHDPVVPSLKNKNVVSSPNRKRKSSKALPEIKDNKNETASLNNNKKIVHRDVERQRRQEMAALNRSLKSLLPPEILKGKRSLCDHIHESVNHIGHMKNTIDELSKKRNELKRPLNKLTIYVGSKCLSSNISETEPDEEIAKANIQILLSTSQKAEAILSRSLRLLIQEGLDIISYTSTNSNERLVHTIVSEVSEGRSINPYELQTKLRYLIA